MRRCFANSSSLIRRKLSAEDDSVGHGARMFKVHFQITKSTAGSLSDFPDSWAASESGRKKIVK